MRPERGAATPAKGRETRPHRVRSTSQERHRCSAAGREDRREESTATGTDDSSWGEGSAGERHRDDSEPCGLSGFRATHGRPPVGNAGPSQPAHDVNHRTTSTIARHEMKRPRVLGRAWCGPLWSQWSRPTPAVLAGRCGVRDPASANPRSREDRACDVQEWVVPVTKTRGTSRTERKQPRTRTSESGAEGLKARQREHPAVRGRCSPVGHGAPAGCCGEPVGARHRGAAASRAWLRLHGNGSAGEVTSERPPARCRPPSCTRC